MVLSMCYLLFIGKKTLPILSCADGLVFRGVIVVITTFRTRPLSATCVISVFCCHRTAILGRGCGTRVAAVSYTHLDVYKRQVVAACAKPCPTPPNVPANIALATNAPCLDTRLPRSPALPSSPATYASSLVSTTVPSLSTHDSRSVRRLTRSDEMSPYPVSYTHLDVYKRQERRVPFNR